MPRYLNESITIARRILLEMWRARRSLIFWVAFPALMLVLFGLIYAGGGHTSSSFENSAPGILIGAAMFFSCLGGPVAMIVGNESAAPLVDFYFAGIVLAHCLIAWGQPG